MLGREAGKQVPGDGFVRTEQPDGIMGDRTANHIAVRKHGVSDDPVELTGGRDQYGRFIDDQVLEARRTFRQEVTGLRIA